MIFSMPTAIEAFEAEPSSYGIQPIAPPERRGLRCQEGCYTSPALKVRKAATMNPKAARAGAVIVKTSKDVIGKRVVNHIGEDVGKIEEVMIDFNAARVTYAIVSFGGFLGMGNKLFAVPWVSLKYVSADEHFVINADKHLLEKAPGFDKDDWPDLSDPTQLSEIYQYYGSFPYWPRDARLDRQNEQ